TGANGSDIAARAGAVGFRYCSLAENIAKGQKSLEAVMAGWAGSPGHRRNMLKRDVRVFGLARAKGNIWVMELGREGC
ncbi:MAG: CAP domain-containing protein, partial [Rhodobacterales bacterium]